MLEQIVFRNRIVGGDKMGISLALELDGVNPFHNIGVLYSMTPMMLTVLDTFEILSKIYILLESSPVKGSRKQNHRIPLLKFLWMNCSV